MPSFGYASRKARSTCHPLLKQTVDAAIEYWDFALLYGWRGREEQDALFEANVSKVRWPNSKHNHLSTKDDVDAGWAEEVGIPLSLAFDFAPWHSTGKHIRWEVTEEFYYFSGFIQGIAGRILSGTSYDFRYGGDWDQDQDLRDQTFMDLGHIELVAR